MNALSVKTHSIASCERVISERVNHKRGTKGVTMGVTKGRSRTEATEGVTIGSYDGESRTGGYERESRDQKLDEDELSGSGLMRDSAPRTLVPAPSSCLTSSQVTSSPRTLAPTPASPGSRSIAATATRCPRHPPRRAVSLALPLAGPLPRGPLGRLTCRSRPFQRIDPPPPPTPYRRFLADAIPPSL